MEGCWNAGVHSHLRPKLVEVHQQQASGGGRPVRSCDAMDENGAPRIDSLVHEVEERLEELMDGLGRAARVTRARFGRAGSQAKGRWFEGPGVHLVTLCIQRLIGKR